MSLLTVREDDRGVVVVSWDDGENRFNLESLDEWHSLLDDLEGRDGPLSLVLTGKGKFFSNGLDLDRFAAAPGEAGRTVEELHRLLGRLLLLPAWTVAAINGHAFAAGAMLTCAVDRRMMRTGRGFWCLPEVDLGLPLTDAMTAVVTARLPRLAASDAMISARRYTAEEALRTGIVDSVHEEGRCSTRPSPTPLRWPRRTDL
ncbi:MAG: enoyl-CoA hydratase/isomerase family protein [Microthrixaceae bacterium]